MIHFVTGEEIAAARRTIKHFIDIAIDADTRRDHAAARGHWAAASIIADLMAKDAEARDQNKRDNDAGVEQMRLDAINNGGH